MINISISNQTNWKEFDENGIKKVVEDALLKIGIENDLVLEVIFADEEEIRKLNKKHRDVDKPTDVLSFPQTHFKESKLNILGSIVICPNVAEKRKIPIEELVKHGILHLLGYDHETDEPLWEKASKKINCNY